jgi:hypothetical protein
MNAFSAEYFANFHRFAKRLEAGLVDTEDANLFEVRGLVKQEMSGERKWRLTAAGHRMIDLGVPPAGQFP